MTDTNPQPEVLPDLESCPFCGSQRLTVNSALADPFDPEVKPGVGCWWIGCNSCRATGPEKRTERDARALWNQATLQPTKRKAAE